VTSIPLVVFYNADLELVQEWADAHPDVAAGMRVVADRKGEVYRALGTKRSDPVRLVGGSLVAGLKSARRGLLPKATRADMLRLGADAAVDADGEIVLLHIASSPDDRLPVEELLTAAGRG
jgi:hypothetical protein